MKKTAIFLLGAMLMGIVVDNVAASKLAAELGAGLSITAEQIGMRAGVLVNSIFPAIGIVIVLAAMKYFKRQSE